MYNSGVYFCVNSQKLRIFVHFVCAKRRKVRLIFQAIVPFLTFPQNFCLDISSRIGTMVVVVILQNLKV